MFRLGFGDGRCWSRMHFCRGSNSDVCGAVSRFAVLALRVASVLVVHIWNAEASSIEKHVFVMVYLCVSN